MDPPLVTVTVWRLWNRCHFDPSTTKSQTLAYTRISLLLGAGSLVIHGIGYERRILKTGCSVCAVWFLNANAQQQRCDSFCYARAVSSKCGCTASTETSIDLLKSLCADHKPPPNAVSFNGACVTTGFNRDQTLGHSSQGRFWPFV